MNSKRMALCRVRSLWAISKSQSGSFFSPPSLGQFSPFCRTYSSISSQIGNVGFVGIGNMGYHMVNNLLKAGYQVTINDINRNVMKMFADRGVTIRETPFGIAETSDVVITMLPSPSHVVDVYTGPNGLIHAGKSLRPWLFIDSSTIDPQTSRKLSEAVSNCILEQKKDNCDKPVMLDAPVSGGVVAAEAGSLTFMVTCQPGWGSGSGLFECERIVPCYGQECDLLRGSRKWFVPGLMEGVPSSRNYDGGFASKLMAKDLSLAAASAAELGLKCPLTSQSQEIYKELCNEGHENKDFSCVFRHYYPGKDEH